MNERIVEIIKRTAATTDIVWTRCMNEGIDPSQTNEELVEHLKIIEKDFKDIENADAIVLQTMVTYMLGTIRQASRFNKTHGLAPHLEPTSERLIEVAKNYYALENKPPQAT